MNWFETLIVIIVLGFLLFIGASIQTTVIITEIERTGSYVDGTRRIVGHVEKKEFPK